MYLGTVKISVLVISLSDEEMTKMRTRLLHGQADGQTREIIEESLLHLLLLLLPCGNKKCFPHHVAIKSSQEAEEGTEDLTCSFSPSSLCPTIAMAACLLLDKEGYNFKRQKQGENTLASGEFRLAFFFKKGTMHGNGFL